LRLFGLNRFRHPHFASGHEIIAALTDEARSRAHFSEPIFVQTRSGIRYRDLCEIVGDGSPSMTLKTMAKLGRRLGFPMRAVKLTVAELAAIEPPIVIHVEEGGIGSGRFMLVLGVGEAGADLIDGSAMTYTQLSRDRFRRGWTGYALIDAGPPWTLWARRAAAVVVGVMCHRRSSPQRIA